MEPALTLKPKLEKDTSRGKKNKNKNKTVDQQSNDFWQWWQHHSMKKEQFFQQIVWGNFDMLMHKSEIGSLLITIHKN